MDSGGPHLTGEQASTIHGTALVIREIGVLIRGPSGAGKSSLALLLIEASRQRGWFARLVGDDRLLLRLRHGIVLAAPHPTLAGLIERRTQPLVAMVHEPSCRVGLVVDLLGADTLLRRLPAADRLTTCLLGNAELPLLRMQAPLHLLWCTTVLDKLAAL